MNDYLKFIEGKARFAAWLSIFFLLLITIPALLGSELKSIAKIFGIVVVVLLSFALWFWRTQTIRRVKRKSRVPLNLNDLHWLNEHIPFYKLLSKEDKVIFEDRLALFLAETIISEIGKEVPEKSTCFYVGSSAVITFWGLPYWNYGPLSEVLVYPDDFTLENQIDPKGNVQGKVHHGGIMDSTMILSLPSVIKGFSNALDGKNVGVHEFAHLLDKADKHIDGIPFMLNSSEREIWTTLVEKEFSSAKVILNIDPYAFTNRSEFFAVIFEIYKENPDHLKKMYPELYGILKKYFPSKA
jgi:Mlc titration factor MtfA (ptsG expression regulator)